MTGRDMFEITATDRSSKYIFSNSLITETSKVMIGLLHTLIQFMENFCLNYDVILAGTLKHSKSLFPGAVRAQWTTTFNFG